MELSDKALSLPESSGLSLADFWLRYWIGFLIHFPTLIVLQGWKTLTNLARSILTWNRRISLYEGELKPGIRAASSWWLAWVLPLVATGGLILAGPKLPSWAFMWLLAIGIFFTCKGLTVSRWMGRSGRFHPSRLLGYWLAWPGMDAHAFMGKDGELCKHGPAEWMKGCLGVLTGACLIWVVAGRFWPTHPILTGWLGMAGIVMLLHFGLFELLALGWRSRGVRAPSLMCSPIASRSLGEFWGRRWNTAFRTLAHQFVFAPFYSRIGGPGATMAVFLASGLVHDVVISFPAGSGFGMPTLYFGIQGLGVLFERSEAGRRLGARRGLSGRLFALAAATLPIGLLFHSAFIERVMIPFQRFIGGLL